MDTMETTQKLRPRHGKRPGEPMPYGTIETTHGEQERNDDELERFREGMEQLLQGSQTIAMLESLAQC